MAEGFYKEVCDELKRHDFRYRSNAKGSHEKWERDADGKKIIVPRNLKSRHTANGIMKDIGSTKRF